MNEELKEKINLFVKDYQELCKKHGLQIASYPKLNCSNAHGEFSIVAVQEVIEFKE